MSFESIPKGYATEIVGGWENKALFKFDLEHGLRAARPKFHTYLSMSSEELFQYDQQVRERDFSFDPQDFYTEGEHEFIHSMATHDKLLGGE